VRRADSLLVKKEFDLSAKLWKETVQLSSPKSPEYHLYKSKWLFSTGKIEQAAGNYVKAVENFEQAQLNLGSYSGTIETSYQIDIYNALYHSLASAGEWEKALQIGNAGLKFFDKTVDTKV